jgi:transmembrane sensor
LDDMKTSNIKLTAEEAEPADDDLESQATLWVVKLTSGEATAEERAAFQRWRDASPEHAAALVDARRLWLALGPALQREETRRVRRLGSRTQLGAIAASLLAVALIGGQYVESQSHDYVTVAGERRSVVLSDGTQVLMNGRTALDVSFKGGARRVTLARGEAYFDVVHDPLRPFSVGAGAGQIRDIGTAFAVRRTGDGADVLVARGEVDVAPALPGAPTTLTPNQALTYHNGHAGAVHTEDAAQALSWVHGRLILDNRSLADSVPEINRYYQGRLMLLDTRAGARRINAVIDLNRIDDWLDALDKTHAAKVARAGSLVFLY